jgi:predicted transcriptional regulator
MKPYCMIVVKYLLPTVRSIIMKQLIEDYGLKKNEVAKRMFISPSAVTRYLVGDRGSHFTSVLKDSDELMKIIKDISNNIANQKNLIPDLTEEICDLCNIVRKEGLMCDLHNADYSESELKECGICLT